MTSDSVGTGAQLAVTQEPALLPYMKIGTRSYHIFSSAAPCWSSQSSTAWAAMSIPFSGLINYEETTEASARSFRLGRETTRKREVVNFDPPDSLPYFGPLAQTVTINNFQEIAGSYGVDVQRVLQGRARELLPD
jgi:hypothetical protein